MAHNTVEPVPFFFGIREDSSPSEPDHAPVVHPPRARFPAPDNPVADLHLNAAAEILLKQGELPALACRMDVDRPVPVPETDRDNVGIFTVRKADPGDKGLIQDGLNLSP